MSDHRRRILTFVSALLLLLGLIVPSFAATYKTLEFGSYGTAVLSLQKALAQLGYYSGTLDSKYGNATRDAVMEYQNARGLTPDGKAGNITQTSIYTELKTSSSVAASGSLSSSGLKADTIGPGEKSDRVKTLQKALKKLGFYSGSCDGSYGPATKRAVKGFQKKYGLYADGLAGAKTQTLLFAKANMTPSVQQTAAPVATATPTPVPTPAPTAAPSANTWTRTLRSGYTGSDVSAVQKQLKSLGYYKNTIDGKYGSGTMEAVRAFQQNNGLTADGLTGQATWNKLFSSNAKPFVTPTPVPAPTPTQKPESTSLRVGDSGVSVKTMQTALAKLGYSVSADGDYGAQTALAVKEFQQQNGLTADGVAGEKTLALLYSGNAKKCPVQATAAPASSGTSYTGSSKAPDGKSVSLLHWFNEVKSTMSNGSILYVYDPATGIAWNLRVMSRGRHCDVEPYTAEDTEKMNRAFGSVTWTPKPVYVKLPNGQWSLATTHNVPHGSQTIKNNNFDGQNCVHFLRDMDECTANDPNYGVTNQKALRDAWKKMTGQVVN